MAKRKLTDRFLASLKPAKPGQRYEIGDTVVPGVAVRVTEYGKSLVLISRFGGKHPTRRLLGVYGKMSLSDARTKAKHWHALLEAGRDPRVEAEREKLAQLRKNAASFQAVSEAFIEQRVCKWRTGLNAAREIRREFAAWAARPIKDIGRADVQAFIRDKAARAPAQAGNLLTHLRSLFAWAIDVGTYGLDTSPCANVSRKRLIGPKPIRLRVLGDDEIRALWHATAELGPPWGTLFRLLLLTGQRLRECSDLRWREIDMDAALWTISATRFKSALPHLVPLSGAVIEQLQSLPRYTRGDYVFSVSFGERPVATFSQSEGSR